MFGSLDHGSLWSRPHTLPSHEENGLVNQVEFLGLVVILLIMVDGRLEILALQLQSSFAVCSKPRKKTAVFFVVEMFVAHGEFSANCQQLQQHSEHFLPNPPQNDKDNNKKMILLL